MRRLTIEYIVDKQSAEVPDEQIIKAVVEHPVEMEFTGPDGRHYIVTLTPDLAYPTTVTT